MTRIYTQLFHSFALESSMVHAIVSNSPINPNMLNIRIIDDYVVPDDLLDRLKYIFKDNPFGDEERELFFTRSVTSGFTMSISKNSVLEPDMFDAYFERKNRVPHGDLDSVIALIILARQRTGRVGKLTFIC